MPSEYWREFAYYVSADIKQILSRTHLISRAGFTCLTQGTIREQRPCYESRWTVAGEKAGRQIATYSAPPSSGVE